MPDHSKDCQSKLVRMLVSNACVVSTAPILTFSVPTTCNEVTAVQESLFDSCVQSSPYFEFHFLAYPFFPTKHLLRRSRGRESKKSRMRNPVQVYT